VELESEADNLRSEISQLKDVLADHSRLIELVISELSEVSQTLGTPRRTALSTAPLPTINPISKSSKAAPNLQVEDSVCAVVLSASGKLARVDLSEQDQELSHSSHRSAHDAVSSLVFTTRRANVGAVTNTGRVVFFSPVSLPGIPPTSISLSGAVDSSAYIDLESGENVIALITLEGEKTYAIATQHGVVKRVITTALPAKSGASIISLKDDDMVVGVSEDADDSELVFITSDAQLLRFSADLVRPQGANASGMSGIRLSDGARVIFFTATQEDASVVTISASNATLLGTDAGRAKLSALKDFPAKGRGTGGVRAQSLLKGDDVLAVAWAGIGEPHANALDGAPRELPTEFSKRDASGTPLTGDVAYVGGSV
jgi:DNA gyrase subunit A